MTSYLFKVFAEGDPKASVSVVEHFTCHEGVENSCAGQWHAEVKAK